MNKEPCFLLYPHKAKKVNAVAARTHSEASGFKHTLEQRDSMCVFSRNHIVNPPRGGAVWSGFTCAPIVPIQLTGTSDMFDASKLSSSGNRLLMSHYLNLVFTVGCIAVNPDVSVLKSTLLGYSLTFLSVKWLQNYCF